MDIEKLIEQYRQAADKWEKRHPVTDTFDLRVQDALRDAATALSTLQAENEKLRAELEQVRRERDAAQSLLAERIGVRGAEPITTAFGLPIDRLRELAQADRLIGMTVYESNKRGFISTYEVISVHISKCSILVGWNLLDGVYSNLNGFEISALGKSVFLTRAEAEAALRGEREEKP